MQAISETAKTAVRGRIAWIRRISDRKDTDGGNDGAAVKTSERGISEDFAEVEGESMEPIRVLQVVEMLNENSGVSSVVLNYYRNMTHDRCVFDFIVHAPIDAELQKELEQTGSHIYQMPELSGKNMPRYKKELRNFFLEHEGTYKIVHGHLPNAAVFYLGEAKHAGVPFRILHSHNSCGSDSMVKRIRNFFLNHMGVCKANLYFACSGCAAEYLYGKNSQKQIRIWNNAIEPQRFSFELQTREMLRSQYQVGDRLVIGHVGRFAEQKNHRFLVEIAAGLKERTDDFILLLVGEGKLRPETEKRVRKLGLEGNVIFTGAVKNPQDYYQMMDVFLLPSLYEGLPVVAVEAQAAGLPCLIADTVTEEVVLTDQVRRLPIQNAAEWANEIHKIPKERRTDAAERIQSRGFDIKNEAQKLEKFYLELVGKEHEEG